MDFSAPRSFATERLASNLWRFGEGFGGEPYVDAYLVIGSARACLIDALESEQPVSLVEQIRGITDLPVDVLLTHGHPDHAGAEVKKMLGAEGFRLYMNHADLPIAAAMIGPWFNAHEVTDLREGDRFELGGLTLETYRVAGHTPGSMVFLDRRNGRCLTGDAFGVWLQTQDALPMAVYVDELKRFGRVVAGMSDTRFWAGHMAQSPGGYLSAEVVADMREACEKVMSGEIVGQDVVLPPELADSPLAAFLRGAKIVQYRTVTGLTYREESIN
jgi:hydroxyacylglutathione hydrolase